MHIMGMGFHLGWPYVLGCSTDYNMECFKEDTASHLPFV